MIIIYNWAAQVDLSHLMYIGPKQCGVDYVDQTPNKVLYHWSNTANLWHFAIVARQNLALALSFWQKPSEML